MSRSAGASSTPKTDPVDGVEERAIAALVLQVYKEADALYADPLEGDPAHYVPHESVAHEAGASTSSPTAAVSPPGASGSEGATPSGTVPIGIASEVGCNQEVRQDLEHAFKCYCGHSPHVGLSEVQFLRLLRDTDILGRVLHHTAGAAVRVG